MKKVLNIVVCLLLLVGFGFVDVEAATLSIGDDSTSAGASDKSVSVELSDSDLSNYVKVEFELTVSGTSYVEIEFKPKPTSMEYKKDGNKHIISALSTDESTDVTKEATLYAATIGIISYTTDENLNSGFKITPTNVRFYKADGTYVSPGEGGVKIDEGTIKFQEPKSNDATLTNLTVSQGELSPKFDSETTEYEVTVPDTIKIIKISGSTVKGATKTGTGNQNLELGENKFEVVVTAEDGETKKTYTIIVNRGEVSEPSAYLESLKINNIGCVLSPEFDKQNNKYTVEVTSDIKELDLQYELEDKNATISIEGNEDFIVGKNVVTITVKSSDKKEEQVYELTVNVVEEESTDESVPVEDENKDKDTKDKGPNWVLIGIIAGVIVILIAGVAFVLFKKKKSKNKKNKQNKKGSIKTDSIVDATTSENESDEESVTKILKNELFDDERTTTYDKNAFNPSMNSDNSEDLEKTKEFNFKDFR